MTKIKLSPIFLGRRYAGLQYFWVQIIQRMHIFGYEFDPLYAHHTPVYKYSKYPSGGILQHIPVWGYFTDLTLLISPPSIIIYGVDSGLLSN